RQSGAGAVQPVRGLGGGARATDGPRRGSAAATRAPLPGRAARRGGLGVRQREDVRSRGVVAGGRGGARVLELEHIHGCPTAPRPDAATNALLDLAAQVRSLGIPIAVTDAAGHVTATANAPPGADADSVALRRWIAGLDGVKAPVVQPGVGTIHYGPLPAARRFMALAV